VVVYLRTGMTARCISDGAAAGSSSIPSSDPASGSVGDGAEPLASAREPAEEEPKSDGVEARGTSSSMSSARGGTSSSSISWLDETEQGAI
jgi:hypothetical protein